ncbi:MAG: peptide deformylase [Atopobiaceae bacterium]|nr:peptide deformylase [Atopobiaceae bacterium]
MDRPLMKMKFFLQKPSEEATSADLPIAQDLVDTLEVHRATCVGMAANMIGQRKRIIAVIDEDGSALVMLNPALVWGKDSYRTEEGCLSLMGVRPATRYGRVCVKWQDETLRSHERVFTGRVAQAIQHEIDHCNGVLI